MVIRYIVLSLMYVGTCFGMNLSEQQQRQQHEKIVQGNLFSLCSQLKDYEGNFSENLSALVLKDALRRNNTQFLTPYLRTVTPEERSILFNSFLNVSGNLDPIYTKRIAQAFGQSAMHIDCFYRITETYKHDTQKRILLRETKEGQKKVYRKKKRTRINR